MTSSHIRLISRGCAQALALLLAGQGGGACGGNYSNDDLEFQSAMPASSTLQPQIRAVVRADSAEYYLFTQVAVRDFGALRDGLLGIVEETRRHPPTTRAHELRVWGPWRDDKDPGRQHRMIIEKIPAVQSPLGFLFRYRLQVARWSSTQWADFVTGEFQPTRGIRRGEGEVIVTTAGLRALGLPLDSNPNDQDPELTWLDTLTIHYRTIAPVAWTVVANAHRDWLVGKPDGAQQARWEYQEIASGGGTMPDTARFRFVFRGAVSLWLQAAQVTSAWRLTDFAGRADLTVTEGLATGSTATDCWDGSTRATYVRRDWAQQENRGDPATCVFLAAE